MLQEAIDRVKKFHEKHRFDVGVDLRSCESTAVSAYLEEVASELLLAAKDLEIKLNGGGSFAKDPRIKRTQLMIEELGEVIQALASRDIVGTLDGLADLDFTTHGTAVTFRLPLDEMYSEVCDSNDTKEPRRDDDPRLRRKGNGYRPPDGLKIAVAAFGPCGLSCKPKSKAQCDQCQETDKRNER